MLKRDSACSNVIGRFDLQNANVLRSLSLFDRLDALDSSELLGPGLIGGLSLSGVLNQLAMRAKTWSADNDRLRFLTLDTQQHKRSPEWSF